MNLSPTELFNDRKIFLIGSTGFLGKVTLSMLLHSFPNIGRVYVTVRARSQEESEARFWNSVITAPPFDPLRKRYGSALDGFIRDKVAVLGGDGNKDLGLDTDALEPVTIFRFDLLEARFYLSFFQVKDVTAAIQKIEDRHHEIKKELAAKVRHQLRSIPVLKFFQDDTLDHVFKMEELFKKIKPQDPEGK